MNKKNVRQTLVKLLCGLMLVLVLIGASVPAVFAAEEATTEAVTEAESTEAESTAPEQEESKTGLPEDQIRDLAVVLGSNDLARQLFWLLAATTATVCI